MLIAVAPVIVLCHFIYKKDLHKESPKILGKLFTLGFLSCVPVLVVELILDIYFPTENVSSNITLFINIFISVALVEEGFKWLVTKKNGYDSQEFDEIYDIIVYSVFASLGFACIENILYVFTMGLSTGITRAIFSIPGHTCFSVLMGYYLSKAKLASVNNNNSLYGRNLFLSLFVPALVHATYDFLIFANLNGLFFFADIVMVCVCFKTVDKISKMQQSINNNLSNGSLAGDDGGHIQYVPTGAVGDGTQGQQINFCPVCGRKVNGGNFCSSCGFKLR